MFEEKMAAKAAMEEEARGLQRKMEKASALISGLAGEKVRWGENVKTFGDVKKRLVGDCAISCAFTSYCGAFNQTFRSFLIHEKFLKDCRARSVPVTDSIEVTEFLVDGGTVGDWQIQELPRDKLSTQNGILVTQASRFPLMIDPQGQAIKWLLNKEAKNLPHFGTTQLKNSKLKDQLQFCMSEGKSLLVVGVEEEIDPLLDPVMEKRIIQKGRSKFINVADTMMEYSQNFRLFFVTRLPNPFFSPELQAKTTVIDFTVTMLGLEDQLLARVIQKEQSALEEQLDATRKVVNENTKALLMLDAMLLKRLTDNTGSLLDDEDLIGVLADTKNKAEEVKIKLKEADETKMQIDEKREQYRSVATRGSIMYFSIVEMSNVNCMYQTSLQQFLSLFAESMEIAVKAKLASKRSENIIHSLTYLVYRYINKGLYEVDKLLFVLVFTMKIMVVANHISTTDVSLLLRGGAALDINSVRPNPFKKWLPDEAYLNCLALSQAAPTFKTLIEKMTKSELMWIQWYNENEPESVPVPDYEGEILQNSHTGPFLRLTILRTLRVDRMYLGVRQMIRDTAFVGPRYVEPVTDTVENVYEKMTPDCPTIYLLSIGADPTDAIESMCRKKKLTVDSISMGEGQEPVAEAAIRLASEQGSWVLLQNCELGLPLMEVLEDLLIEEIFPIAHPNFRLFITAAEHPKFPLGLLQMCTKVTNEPPAGMRAGVMRSYTVMVDQDRLERIDTELWRQLLFNLCFLHSVVQERRKFGSLGWCIPYEYNNGDLDACIMFLEKHLYSGVLSWATLRYMIAEAQYGGKITDDMDRRLFKAYTEAWVGPHALEEGFTFNPESEIQPIPGDFKYSIPSEKEVSKLRDFASQFPDIDNPEIYGMHPNADLTFRRKEAAALLQTLGDTQPKEGGGGEGLSREDLVYEKAGELLEKMPGYFQSETYMRQIRKQGGLEIPMNVFLFQEVSRFQMIMKLVGDDLKSFRLAIKGEVTMTLAIAGAINEIFEAKVPKSWVFTITNTLFSWMLPTIGLWFNSMRLRHEQFNKWLVNKRPLSFWMTGFFNAQGFLTAMKQEITRAHRKDEWALDDIVYHAVVKKMARVDQVGQRPDEGVFVHGLYLDGAGWSSRQESLVESEPKKLFYPLPIIHVTATTQSIYKNIKADLYGKSGGYECPVYTYQRRTDLYYIFTVTLPPGKYTSRHWILRGVALLCNTEA
jgi:dynein heavy chain